MKKGFTLIELLSVIVILAIIAVIAVPIVLNIINNTKESAVLRSAQFYLDGVETSIATSILKNIQIPDGTYSIMQDGNICIGTLANNTCSGDILKVEVDGEVPSSGTITIVNGQISDISLNLSNKVIVKNDKGELVLSKPNEEEEKQLAPGLYDENDKLLASWDELVEKYDFKNVIERDTYNLETGEEFESAIEILESNYSNAHKLIIDGSVSNIGFEAFGFGEILKVVVIEEGVTSIGDYAFIACYSLETITIPDSVTSIGQNAFYNCSSLTTVIIEAEVTSIGDYVFLNCESLTSITIPDSVTSIGEGAFSGCTSLTSITIPSSVTSINVWAFSGCPSLTNIVVDSNNPVYDSRDNSNAIIETVTNTLIIGCKNTIIPDTVTSIGESAFRDCPSLTSITIPSSVTSIGEGAFYMCGSLTTVIIEEGATCIGNYAFSECSSLTSITIPDSVTSIGESAFSACPSLTSITIPSSVTSINVWAFSGCPSLTNIVVDSNNPVYDSRDNSNAIIETVTNTLIIGCKNTIIPDTVTSIGDYVFSYCPSLTSITIPSSVTSIGYYAFESCENLTTINYAGSETEWNAIQKYADWDYETPSNKTINYNYKR